MTDLHKQFDTDWLFQHPLTPVHVDCANTVMLQILDGKCKMNTPEKMFMTSLYDALQNSPGVQFYEGIHMFISDAREHLDGAMKNHVYEKRLLAETMISRPVMKAFKVMIREQGQFTEPSGADISKC